MSLFITDVAAGWHQMDTRGIEQQISHGTVISVGASITFKSTFLNNSLITHFYGKVTNIGKYRVDIVACPRSMKK